ncbi:MAG: spore coat associated protein CotJA, partial [Ruminiclostridium sp.]
YVPFQHLDKVYPPDKALWRGTIFPELDISINEYERGLYDGK